MEKIRKCGLIGQSPVFFPFGWDWEDPKCLVLQDSIRVLAKRRIEEGVKSFLCVPDSGVGLWFS